MSSNRLRIADGDNLFGDYLKNRRAKLDPAALGFGTVRRRTPGLRREEVAMRANISPTWYTWLEQGRGGAPSADALDRIASALLLTENEREYLFILALGHPPMIQHRDGADVLPRLQRILDALDPIPALVRNAKWDVLAWNLAASVILHDYSARPPGQRNVIRHIFADPQARAEHYDWDEVARFTLGVFRADIIRAGATEEVKSFIEEMCQTSAEFESMWKDADIRSPGGGVRRIRHPQLGSFSFDFSALSVDGRPDWKMHLFYPTDPSDTSRIRNLVENKPIEALR